MSDAPSTRRTVALAALYCLVPPAAVAGGMAMAPLTALAGLVAAPWRRLLARPVLLVGAPLMALMAWAAISQAWSPYAPEAATLAQFFDTPPQGAKLLLGAAMGLMLVAAAGLASPADRRLIRASGIGACLVLAAMLFIETFGMPLNRLVNDEPNLGVVMRNPGKGGVILVTLLWGALGALLALRRRRGLALAFAAGLALATLWLSFQFDMDATAAGFAAGAAGFGCGFLIPRLAPLVAGWGLAGFTLLAPALYGLLTRAPRLDGAVPLSWEMRLEIWRYTVARIAEAPFFGRGLDSVRVVQDRVQAGPIDFIAIPLHPHAMSLHVWYELGAVGAILLAATFAALGVVASRAARHNRIAAAAACGTIATAGLIYNVSFGAWQEWWMGSIFAAAGLCAALFGQATPKA